MSDTIVKIIAAIAGVLVAMFGYLKDRQVKSLKREVKDVEVKSLVLSKIRHITLINIIKNKVDQLFENTKASRFLLIMSINGHTAMRAVSVVFNHQKPGTQVLDAEEAYKHVETDDQYRDMLKEILIKGSTLLNVEEMPKCKLKSFYDMEGVTHSLITFLGRYHIDEKDDVLIFSSMATHNVSPFFELELTEIELSYGSCIKPCLDKMFLETNGTMSTE